MAFELCGAQNSDDSNTDDSYDDEAPPETGQSAEEDKHLLSESEEGEHELIRDVKKEDWLRRAHDSEASGWVDKCLQDKFEDWEIKKFKAEMWDLTYAALGDELLPEDMRRILVVRTERYPHWQLPFYKCITCGFFALFRPHDDEAVLVLTKRERVLMYKNCRLSFFGNILGGLVALRNYALVLVGFFACQLLVVQILSLDLWRWEVEGAEDFAEEVRNVMNRHRWVEQLVFTSLTIGLVMAVWSKCPHDYGTRSRQSHAANKVCIGQYSLTGGLWRREAMLRLHFGRYPEQDQLDHQMLLNGPPAVCAIPREQLSTHGFGLNPFSSRASRKTLFIAAIFMLNALTLVDAGLTYVYAPFQVALEAQSARRYCKYEAKTEEMCTRDKCEEWAIENTNNIAFCSRIGWLSTTNDTEVLHCKLMYSNPGPCCKGCEQGVFDAALGDWFEQFRMMIGFLTDLGTILFGFSAVSAVLHVEKERGHIDLKWARRPLPKYYLSDFYMTQPLGMRFIEGVFESAYSEEATKVKLNSSQCSYEEQKSSDELDGDEDANFRDTANFHEQNEYTDWEDFFNGTDELPAKSMVQADEDKWRPRVNVPQKILGLGDDEKIIGAWSEKPEVSLLMASPLLLGALVVWLLTLTLGRDQQLAFLKFFGGKVWQWVMAVTLMTLALLFIGLTTLYVYYFVAQKHAVILTDRRIFYVRYRDKCRVICMYTVQVRVDIFRHDHDISYGSMLTNPPSLYMRLRQAPWTPGIVRIQPIIYGVLQLNRQRGNVLNVYQSICRMVEAKRPVVNESMIQEAGVSWDICKKYVQGSMEKQLPHVWRITAFQADDTMGQAPDLFLANADEQPLFYWSFKEFGWLSQPTSTNTDVIVTTNRIYKYSRANFKPYDCRTALCFGACYCTLLKRLLNGPKYLQRASSFLMLPSLLSFNSEVEVSPPLWYDPQRLPIKVPCWETSCRLFTALCTCALCSANFEGIEFNAETCGIMPRRGAPRAELWMMWRHRFNALQPDLMCKIRPFQLKDRAFVEDLWDAFGCGAQQIEDERIGEDTDYKRVDMLRKIMGVVQDTEAGMRLPWPKLGMRKI